MFEKISSLLIVILAWFSKFRTATNLKRFDRKGPVHMWPYLSHFVARLTNFAKLDVFYRVRPGRWVETVKLRE